MPKISVIMSVYNEREDFLKKSIQSILNQNVPDLEFLIVNDGSNQKTYTLLENYAEQDQRIVLVNNNQNIGLTKSLNTAIQKSQGEYIARMDSDDISLPDRLKKQLDFLQKNNFDLIGSNCDIVDENESLLKEKRIMPPKDIKKKLIRGNFFTHSTFFGKRKVFEELYDENFKRSQDYEFLLRIVSKKYKLGYLNESLLLYRTTNQNISTKNATEQEWYAIKARWKAIAEYNYNKIYLIYFLRSFLSFLIPYRLKYFIIYKLNK